MPTEAPKPQKGMAQRFKEANARRSKARTERKTARQARIMKEGRSTYRILDNVKQPFIDGRAFDALFYLSTAGSAAAGTTSLLVKSPSAQEAWMKVASGLAITAAGSKQISDRQKARLQIQGEKFLQRVLTDPDFSRRAELDLVKRFARNPDGTMKLYGTDALGIASVYSVLHKRRKSPDGGYSMATHEESSAFRGVMSPLFRYHALRTGSFDNKQVRQLFTRHGYGMAEREITEIRKLQQSSPEAAEKRIAIPETVTKMLPQSLETASPSTLRQVEDVVLFSSAIVRAKHRNFKNGKK